MNGKTNIQKYYLYSIAVNYNSFFTAGFNVESHQPKKQKVMTKLIPLDKFPILRKPDRISEPKYFKDVEEMNNVYEKQKLIEGNI